MQFGESVMASIGIEAVLGASIGLIGIIITLMKLAQSYGELKKEREMEHTEFEDAIQQLQKDHEEVIEAIEILHDDIKYIKKEINGNPLPSEQSESDVLDE